jgi:hypothetical protein
MKRSKLRTAEIKLRIPAAMLTAAAVSLYTAAVQQQRTSGRSADNFRTSERDVGCAGTERVSEKLGAFTPELKRQL